jgi:hypothetical protein
LGREHIGLPPAMALIDESLHELAQYVGGVAVLNGARTLKSLSELSVNSDSDADIFAGHGGRLYHMDTQMCIHDLSRCQPSFSASFDA